MLCLFGLRAEAASIALSFYQGGDRLELGKVDAACAINRELKIDITSDNAPYQIRQVIVQPITSSSGVPLEDEVLFFYTIRGSNARGSLYKTIKEPLAFRDELIYTSDGPGTSDSFKMVYVFDGRKLSTAGSFYGRIGFVFEPKQGSPQTAVFDISFNVQLEIQAEANTLERPLRLSTHSEQDAVDFITFKLSANPGKRLNIYQQAEPFPVSEKGTLLAEDAFKFYLADSRKKKGEYTSPVEVGRKELLIYTSREGSDTFRINLIIDPEKVKQAEAGTFRGRLVYRLQEHQRQKIIPVDLEITIERVFDMKITTEGLTFYDLKPDTPAQEKEVLINVESNIQRPYQISQRVSAPFTDSAGHTIAGEYFTMRQELVEGKGEIVYKQFEPVEVGEEAIFLSEGKGGDISLRLTYRLKPSIEIVAGTYSSVITYSLSER